MIKAYVAILGYGISAEAARDVAIRLEGNKEDAETFRRGLENLALPM